jgi:hypothetical protein
VPRDPHDPPHDGADVLAEASPLDRYRRLQQRLRNGFAPFTREVCPRCPTPCCRRPAAVTPFDVVLVEELGYQLPAGPEAAGDALDARLGLIPIPTLASGGEPCAFLGEQGCRFPPDLMPVGCVAFLCPYMEAWYTPEQIEAFRDGIAALKRAYRALQTAVLADA